MTQLFDPLEVTCVRCAEAACVTADSKVVTELVNGARPVDVPRLVEALARLRWRCQKCVLQSIAMVWGEQSAVERLNIHFSQRIEPSACIPQLVERLASSEGAKLKSAIRDSEPLAISISARADVLDPTNVYAPTGEFVLGSPVYRGLDEGYYLLTCVADVVLITNTTDRRLWQTCDGLMQLNVTSGTAWSVREPSIAVHLQYHTGLGTCSSAFSSDVPPTIAEGFLVLTSPRTVACMLARYFGLPIAVGVTWIRPHSIRIAEGLSSSVRLISNIVVKPGEHLLIEGNGNSLILGDWQIQVLASGDLVLKNLTVAESTRSSAVFLAGRALVSHSTFRDCSASWNAVTSWGPIAGGAAFFVLSGVLELHHSNLIRNSASRGPKYSLGGAIYADGASVRIIGSVLNRNRVLSTISGAEAAGGAVCATSGTNLTLRNSVAAENDAGPTGNGGALYVELSTLELVASTLVRNSAMFGGGVKSDKSNIVMSTSFISSNSAQSGGGICLFSKSIVSAMQTTFEDNQAGRGGAISGMDSSAIRLVNSTFSRNEAGNITLSTDLDTPGDEWEIAGNSLGGGIHVQSSSVELRGCKAHANVAIASRDAIAAGGFLSAEDESQVTIVASIMQENGAVCKSGESACHTYGGSIFMDTSASMLEVISCTLHRNYVGPGRHSSGGAMFLSPLVMGRVSSSNFTENSASGWNAAGGAMWTGSDRIDLNRSIFGSNVALAIGVESTAAGGAMFAAGGVSSLMDSELTENLAKRGTLAIQATAGACFVAEGARVELVRCICRHNGAGGEGKYETSRNGDPQNFVRAAISSRESSATHIHSLGYMLLDQVRVVEEEGHAILAHSVWWWIVVERGAAVLQQSVFLTSAQYVFDPCPYAGDGRCNIVDGACSSGDYVDCSAEPVEPSPAGKLLHVLSEIAEVLLDSCHVSRLTIRSKSRRVGIVNSVFLPKLETADLVSLVEPPNCGVDVSGQLVCDPRAACGPQPNGTGGVRCSCTDAGLRESSGSVSDGRRCFQETSVMMNLATAHNLLIQAAKPGYMDDTIQFVVAVSGESLLAVQYRMSQTRSTRVPGRPLTNSVRNWSHFDDGASQSLDGHHIIWEVPPTGTLFWLDGSARKFSDKREFSFKIRLGCDPNASCVADGDSVETVFEVLEPVSGSRLSVARVTTLVRSIVSCENTRVFFVDNAQGSVSEASRSIELMLDARDVDMLPLEFTPVAISCAFGEERCDVATPSFGTHLYSISVPNDLTQVAGMYDLAISVMDGWNSSAGRQAQCVVFRRTVIISAGLETLWVIAISGGVALVSVLVVGLVVKFKVSRDRRKNPMLRVGLSSRTLCQLRWGISRC